MLYNVAAQDTAAGTTGEDGMVRYRVASTGKKSDQLAKVKNDGGGMVAGRATRHQSRVSQLPVE